MLPEQIMKNGAGNNVDLRTIANSASFKSRMTNFEITQRVQRTKKIHVKKETFGSVLVSC